MLVRLSLGQGRPSDFCCFLDPNGNNYLPFTWTHQILDRASWTRIVEKRIKGNKGNMYALQGLLQIEESEEPLTADPAGPVTWQTRSLTVAESSNIRNRRESEPQTSAASHQNDLVRINMGKMLMLKNMGYEAMGPVTAVIIKVGTARNKYMCYKCDP